MLYQKIQVRDLSVKETDLIIVINMYIMQITKNLEYRG